MTVAMFENPQKGLYEWVEDVPEALMEDLAALPPDQTARRAGVEHRPGLGYVVPFLNRRYAVAPGAASPGERIAPLDGGPPPDFSMGLVLATYLLGARETGLEGRMVTERELNGGALFFQGVHALPTGRALKRFGRNPRGFVDSALRLGGQAAPAGDAACILQALPKAPMQFILYTADDEFPAAMTVLFDASADKHLPLDAILAMTGLVVRALTED